MKKGKVYLVGAGPGDPGLIAVRGRDILREADVVIYDYLVDRRILRYCKRGAELLGRGRGPDFQQEKITDLLVRKAKEGRRVVRLKGGDPLIFSRCTHELEGLLKSRIEFEVVPGITAASAAASYSGIPLTDSKSASSLFFVAGREALSKKESLLDVKTFPENATLVFYMAVGRLKAVARELVAAGRRKDTPVAIIQDASLPSQKSVRGTLGNIAAKAKERRIRPPAIVIVGDVVDLGKRFGWLEKNKRVLFTGLSGEKFFLPGHYEHVPLIRIEPAENYREFDRNLKSIRDFDWIVFTSRHGVRYFFQRLGALGLDSRVLAPVKIACIGRSTAEELGEYGLRPDLMPQEESSSGLAREFKKRGAKGDRIFLPQSALSGKGLKKALESLGARVSPAVAYRNVMPADLPRLDLKEFDEIVFTSPSTVKNFKRKYRKVPGGVSIRCIGTVTSQQVKRCLL